MDGLLKRLPSAKRAGRLADGRTKDAAESALIAIAGLGPTAKDALPQVLPLLGDPDPKVRALAFEAVAGIRDPSVAPQVTQAFADERKRITAARADWVSTPLPQTYAAGFEPAVRALSVPPSDARTMQRSSEMLQKVAALDNERAAAAGKILRQERAPKELVDDLDASLIAPYAAGLTALGAVHAEGAQALLDEARDDDSSEIRSAAYLGLVGLGGAALRDAENGLFDNALEVRNAVTNALGQAGKPGQAALVEVLPKLAGEKLSLLRALRGDELDPGAAPVLIGLVQAGGGESAVAAHLLGELRSQAAVPALLKVVADPTAAAQREAIWALGQIGDRQAAVAVARELSSESAELRAAAAEALAKLGGPDQVPALHALENDYDVRVRTAATSALAKLSPATGGGK